MLVEFSIGDNREVEVPAFFRDSRDELTLFSLSSDGWQYFSAEDRITGGFRMHSSTSHKLIKGCDGAICVPVTLSQYIEITQAEYDAAVAGILNRLNQEVAKHGNQ